MERLPLCPQGRKEMRMKRGLIVVGCIVALMAGATAASANDKIVSSVSIPATQPVPVIQDNGSASGTIRLNYTYVGYAFPCGPFAQFTLGLTDHDRWADR